MRAWTRRTDAVWDAAERGPYPLLHADARNVLAEIDIHEGTTTPQSPLQRPPTTSPGATPAFAYHYGLTTARGHLRDLGAPEPEMPPYETSKHEPIKEIPSEPADEQPL